jgi:hypothetical protein
VRRRWRGLVYPVMGHICDCIGWNRCDRPAGSGPARHDRGTAAHGVRMRPETSQMQLPSGPPAADRGHSGGAISTNLARASSDLLLRHRQDGDQERTARADAPSAHPTPLLLWTRERHRQRRYMLVPSRQSACAVGTIVAHSVATCSIVYVGNYCLVMFSSLTDGTRCIQKLTVLCISAIGFTREPRRPLKSRKFMRNPANFPE